jgi:hypothetical protein
LHDLRAFVFDTETTGLGDGAAIVELSACVIEGGAVTARFSTLLNPGAPIPPEVAAIHGITDEMVWKAPTFGDVAGAFFSRLAQADIVSVHCPRDATTKGMMNAAAFARMKRGAWFLNTARGGIVNEAALAAALTSGHLYGAGLDVLASEPPEANNPLLTLPNVIAAPHMAGVTLEAWNRMAFTAMRNVLEVLDGQPNREHTVNPEVYGA